MSIKAREKMSESMKGKRVGEKNPFYGKKHSQDTINKIKSALTGKRYPNRKTTNVKRGKDHYNWKGGVSSLQRSIRTSRKWKNWRGDVFEKDNYTCQNLNCPFCQNKKGVFLHPHHIIPVAECLALDWEEEIFDEDNGITYCEEYHLKSDLHKEVV